MKCLIIEDQPPAQRILKKYIQDMGTLTLAGTYSSALKAMEHLQTDFVDLIFLDIHLPNISGIDFLKSMPNPPAVIITTAFPDYALEGYELNVVDYLLKPFSFLRFVKAVSKVPIRRETDAGASGPGEIFIKSGYEYIKIAVPEILYIRSDAAYTEIHLSGQKYLSPEPLKYWIDLLDNQKFVQVHKSFIIQAPRIRKVSGNRIFLENDIQIPIGRAFKEAFTDRFLK